METNMNNSGDSRHRFAGPQKSRSPRKGAQNMQNIPHIIRAATPPSTLADVVIERPHRPRPNAFTVRVLFCFVFFCLFLRRIRVDFVAIRFGSPSASASASADRQVERSGKLKMKRRPVVFTTAAAARSARVGASDETKRKKKTKKNKRKSHSTRIERERL